MSFKIVFLVRYSIYFKPATKIQIYLYFTHFHVLNFIHVDKFFNALRYNHLSCYPIVGRSSFGRPIPPL